MTTQPIEEGTILWEPSEERKTRANIADYLRWLESEKGLAFLKCIPECGGTGIGLESPPGAAV